MIGNITPGIKASSVSRIGPVGQSSVECIVYICLHLHIVAASAKLVPFGRYPWQGLKQRGLE